MKKLLALVLCLMAMFCFAMAEDVQPIYTEDFEDGTHELYFVASPPTQKTATSLSSRKTAISICIA